jgi:hypothetical protein
MNGNTNGTPTPTPTPTPTVASYSVTFKSTGYTETETFKRFFSLGLTGSDPNYFLHKNYLVTGNTTTTYYDNFLNIFNETGWDLAISYCPTITGPDYTNVYKMTNISLTIYKNSIFIGTYSGFSGLPLTLGINGSGPCSSKYINPSPFGAINYGDFFEFIWNETGSVTPP